MAKSVFSKREGLWILVPDLVFIEEIEKGEFSDIDLFCLVGQDKLIEKFFQDGGQEGEINREIDHWKLEVFMGLQNRIQIHNFFSAKLNHQTENVLRVERGRQKEQVHDYVQHQKFLALMNAQTNAFFGIDEFCWRIDEYLKVNYWNEIEKSEEDYWGVLAIRHGFQHEEVPLVSVNSDSSEILITFNHLDRIKNQRIIDKLPWLKTNEKHTFVYVNKREDNLFDWLNAWAKKHLNDIRSNEKYSFIDKKKTTNGSLRFIEMTMNEILNLR